jgi:hypothetical protein
MGAPPGEGSAIRSGRFLQPVGEDEEATPPVNPAVVVLRERSREPAKMASARLSKSLLILHMFAAKHRDQALAKCLAPVFLH